MCSGKSNCCSCEISGLATLQPIAVSSTTFSSCCSPCCSPCCPPPYATITTNYNIPKLSFSNFAYMSRLGDRCCK
jgi:hypothetical protein